MSLNIAPDHTTTMVSTFYRATYLIQYCQQRGFLYVFAFSNRENEFKYYNTVALCASFRFSDHRRPQTGPAVLSTSDNLLMVHYKVSQVSFCVDIADVPFDAASNMSLPAVTKNAVSKLELILSSNEVYQKAEIQKAIEDPSFRFIEEPSLPYRSYEVTISSASIGLELESTFSRWAWRVGSTADCS